MKNINAYRLKVLEKKKNIISIENYKYIYIYIFFLR